MWKSDFSFIHSFPLSNIFLSEPATGSYMYQCYQIEIVCFYHTEKAMYIMKHQNKTMKQCSI